MTLWVDEALPGIDDLRTRTDLLEEEAEAKVNFPKDRENTRKSRYLPVVPR